MVRELVGYLKVYIYMWSPAKCTFVIKINRRHRVSQVQDTCNRRAVFRFFFIAKIDGEHKKTYQFAAISPAGYRSNSFHLIL